MFAADACLHTIDKSVREEIQMSLYTCRLMLCKNCVISQYH